MKPSSYFLIAIMVIMVVIIGLSLSMRELETKLLPLIISGIVFSLGAIQLTKEVRPKTEAGGVRDPAGERVDRRRFLLAVAWVFGLFFGIWLVGFLIAIPLFVASYMKLNGIRWHMAIIWAVASLVFLYGLFEFLLNVELYRGLVPIWLGY